jgi:hypothetical protein
MEEATPRLSYANRFSQVIWPPRTGIWKNMPVKILACNFTVNLPKDAQTSGIEVDHPNEPDKMQVRLICFANDKTANLEPRQFYIVEEGYPAMRNWRYLGSIQQQPEWQNLYELLCTPVSEFVW